MAVGPGWLLDKSAAARDTHPVIGRQLEALAGLLYVCPMGRLEQLYSAQSAPNYDALVGEMERQYWHAPAPSDILERALALQRDLAHHHGMWHRVAIPDLIIAETALFHGLGVVHVDGDYEKIAEVRSLTQRRLG